MRPRPQAASVDADERMRLQEYLDTADKPLQPATSREEGLRLLRKLQYWIGASPIWWGRPARAFGNRSPWDFILEGGDPEYLLQVVRRNRRPLE